MAQDTNVKRKKTKHEFMQTYGLKTDDDYNSFVNRLIRRIRDPTAPFYEGNFDLINSSKWVSSSINELLSIIEEHGDAFRMDDGTFCRPDDNFRSIYNRYWSGFKRDAVRFMAGYGFLAWYKFKLRNGHYIPIVCDPNKIDCNPYCDSITMETGVRVSWLDQNDLNPQIYVLNEGLHTKITTWNTAAPVDYCKEQIAMGIYMDHSRIQILQNMARPQIMLKNLSKQNGPGFHSDRLEANEGIYDELMKYSDMLGEDDFARSRVEDAIMSAGSNNLLKAVKSIPPPMQLFAAINHSIEVDYRYIPTNMEPHNLHQSVAQSMDYAAVRTQLETEVRAIFGLEAKPMQTAAAGGVSKSGGGGGSAGGATGSASKYTPVVKQWMNSISYVLTSVFKTLHQHSEIKDGDVKITYAEENRRLVSTGRIPMQADKLITLPKESAKEARELQLQLAENSHTEQYNNALAAIGEKIEEPDDIEPPARKKLRVGNGEGSWQHEDDDDYDDDDDIEDDNDKKKRNKKADNKNIDISNEKQIVKEKETQVLRAITIQPFAMVLCSRDDAESFMNQGGMTQDRFFELHPPVAGKEGQEDEKHEKETGLIEKKIAELKEKENAIKEKEKEMKEKEADNKRKEEMKELHMKIKDLESLIKTRK